MRPKILFSAYAFYPSFGGLEQQIYLLGQTYLRAGYEVDVLTEKTAPELPAYEVIDGINVYRMPYQHQRTPWSYLVLGYHLLRFQLLHGRTYQLMILRAALTFYPLMFGVGKWLHLYDCPTFVTADTGGTQDEIIRVKNWPLHKLLLFFFNRHTVLNSACQDNYRHYLELGFPPSKLTQIGNGIDITPFNKAKYPTRVTTFLFLARLIKEKGIRETLAAFQIIAKENPSIKLLIGGAGPESQFIKKFIRTQQLEQSIVYLGPISNDAKEAFFARGECLIQPSYSEGFGLVYAEAAVRKKVLIATDVADLKRTFGDQIYWCQKQSVKSLVEAMQTVLNEPNFSHLDYAPIIPRYNLQKIADSILEVAFQDNVSNS